MPKQVGKTDSKQITVL